MKFHIHSVLDSGGHKNEHLEKFKKKMLKQVNSSNQAFK
jgi:hypothetical protein